MISVANQKLYSLFKDKLKQEEKERIIEEQERIIEEQERLKEESSFDKCEENDDIVEELQDKSILMKSTMDRRASINLQQ